MTKRFFLAALAAVALSMGFTACDDDDVDAGKYEMEGGFSIIDFNTDSVEYKHIIDVYSQALGINTEDMEFTIHGKDSMDCVNNIKKCCEQAEALLTDVTWSGVYYAEACIKDYKISVYEHQFGQGAENSNIHELFPHWFDKPMSYPGYRNETLFTTGFSVQNNGETNPIDSDWSPYTWYCSRRVNFPKDDRNNLYLCMQVAYYSVDDVKQMVKNDDSRLNELVGDVLVLYFYNGNYPNQFTYNGATYKVCGGGTMGEKAPIDLNYKSGGPYMYLYVSHDVKHFNRVLNAGDISLFEDDDDFFFEDTWGERNSTSQLVQGVRMNDSGFMSNHYEDGIDFNLGCGKSFYLSKENIPDCNNFIKLRLCYIPLDELRGE